jgi:hypothetical protein
MNDFSFLSLAQARFNKFSSLALVHKSRSQIGVFDILEGTSSLQLYVHRILSNQRILIIAESCILHLTLTQDEEYT